MHKRRKQENDDDGVVYSVPVPKTRGGKDKSEFKPGKEEFLTLFNEAVQNRLCTIIKGHIKEKGESDMQGLKLSEKNRKKVPRFTYDDLDSAHGSYWTHHALNRLKLSGLKTYKNYVEKNFERVLLQVKNDIKKEKDKQKSNPRDMDKVQEEEGVKSIVVPMGQVIRDDLPAETRLALNNKLEKAIGQFTDYSCMLSFIVRLNMIKFATSNRSHVYNLIPREFQSSNEAVELPSPPDIPSSTDTKMHFDYTNLYSASHLQVISTVNFGVRGVQKETNKDHPLWHQIQNTNEPVEEKEVEKEFEKYIKEAKEINTTIKKAVVMQLATNIENMYTNGEKFNKALTKMLEVLIKLNLQPENERERRDHLEKMKKKSDKDDTDTTASRFITRNKKRSLLRKYRKLLQKQEEKNDMAKSERLRGKINYISELTTGKESKRKKEQLKKPKSDEDDDIEKVTFGEKGEINISNARVKRLNGKLRWLLHTVNKATINRKDIAISDISEEEEYICSKLFFLIKPFMPKKEDRYLIGAQVPLIVLANEVFRITNSDKNIIKLCPEPKPSSLLNLPLDTSMLYMLLTNFGDNSFDLLIKDDEKITSLPTALKNKTFVFASVFNIGIVKELCESRKLSFIHRIMIRPGLVTCVVNGSFIKESENAISDNKKKNLKKPKISAEQQEKIRELEEQADQLNKQCLAQQKDFNLEKADREIRDLKKRRNAISDKEERKVMQSEIKLLKQKRWNEYRETAILRRRLKEIRGRAHVLRTSCLDEADVSKSQNSVEEGFDQSLLTNLNKLKFSGTDYGLKTMSVTVKVSYKMFNAHLNWFNKFFPESRIRVMQEVEPTFHPLPKSHKTTAEQVKYLSMQRKFLHTLEKRKRRKSLGKKVSAIEDQLSTLQRNDKKFFNYAFKEKKTLRSFYFSKKINRFRRTKELRSTQTKDRLCSQERRFVQERKNRIPVMSIGNAGTGVGSRIKKYDRRGGKWMKKIHNRYTITITTDEYLTSQLCVYCYFPITHPHSNGKLNLGTARCLNPECPSFQAGRATSNRDVMSAVAICLIAMTKYLCQKDFPPFSRQ